VRCIHDSSIDPSTVPLPILIGQSSSAASSVLIPVLIGQSSAASSPFDMPLPTLSGLHLPLPILPGDTASSSSVLLPILTPQSASALSSTASSVASTPTGGGNGSTVVRGGTRGWDLVPASSAGTSSIRIGVPTVGQQPFLGDDSPQYAAHPTPAGTLSPSASVIGTAPSQTYPVAAAMLTGTEQGGGNTVSFPSPVVSTHTPTASVSPTVDTLPESGLPYVVAILLSILAGFIILRQVRRADRRSFVES
jgi:hypothetical protein